MLFFQLAKITANENLFIAGFLLGIFMYITPLAVPAVRSITSANKIEPSPMQMRFYNVDTVKFSGFFGQEFAIAGGDWNEAQKVLRTAKLGSLHAKSTAKFSLLKFVDLTDDKRKALVDGGIKLITIADAKKSELFEHHKKSPKVKHGLKNENWAAAKRAIQQAGLPQPTINSELRNTKLVTLSEAQIEVLKDNNITVMTAQEAKKHAAWEHYKTSTKAKWGILKGDWDQAQRALEEEGQPPIKLHSQMPTTETRIGDLSKEQIKVLKDNGIKLIEVKKAEESEMWDHYKYSPKFEWGITKAEWDKAKRILKANNLNIMTIKAEMPRTETKLLSLTNAQIKALRKGGVKLMSIQDFKKSTAVEHHVLIGGIQIW